MGFAKPDLVLVVDGFNLRGDGYPEKFQRPNLVALPRIDSYRGFVFVSFDPEIVDLPTYLAGATEYFDMIADPFEIGMQVLDGSHEYSVKANWKLLVENSVVGYRVPTHQRYFEMMTAAPC